MKKHISLLIAIILVCCSACGRTSDFDMIAKTCSEVTGKELELSNENMDSYSDGYHYVYSQNGSNHPNGIYHFSISSESMRMDLNEYGSTKAVKDAWDSVNIRKEDNGSETSPVLEDYFYEENKDDGYIVYLYGDWSAPNVMFNAEYLIGKDRLSFEINLYSDTGKEDYDKYLEICDKLNLYSSNDITDCIAETDFVH